MQARHRVLVPVPVPVLFLALALVTAAPIAAENLGGGVLGSHGRKPKLVLDSWIPGTASRGRYIDLPAGAFGFVMMSTGVTTATLPGMGTIRVDATQPTFFVLPVPATGIAIASLPAVLDGTSWAMQGLYLDTSGGFAGLKVTDATRVDFFKPATVVPALRVNTLSFVDSAARTVTATVRARGNYVTFTPDRKRAYTNATGSANAVNAVDLTTTPPRVIATIKVTGGIRYGNAMPAGGKLLYVPVHDHIAVIDTNPTSTTYHTVLRKIPVKIAGGSGGIGKGPLDVAVTPDGKKLYVSYGDLVKWPAKGNVGYIDLTSPTFAETLIPVTTGGDILGTSSRHNIETSYDGSLIYVMEYGATPIAGIIKGFVNGSVLSVISTTTNREIAAIHTGSYSGALIAPDRMGRNLWVATMDKTKIGKLLKIDVDPDSSTRFTKQTYYTVSTKPYFGGALIGVGVTPDGSRVMACAHEDAATGSHLLPLVHFFDVLQGRFVGQATVGKFPSAVGVQQR